MVHSTKKLPFLAVVFLLVFSLYAQAQERGDALVSGSVGDARTLVPIIASDTASAEVCSMLFNGLVKYDKDLNLTGDLAQSWEVQDEGKIIVFHLKKGVRWQDGAPFTARDVQFTFQKLTDPMVKTPYSGDFQRIQSLETPDDYTVKVTYKERFAPGLSSWIMPVIPEHLLKNQDLNNAPFARRPVGTGPYKFRSWKTQEKIELGANSTYFQHPPYISRYIYRVIPDEATVFLELETKGLDISGISALQYLRQTDTPFFRKNYRKFRLPSFGYTYLGYNLKDPRFADQRIREALNYAVNKNELVEIVLLGLGIVSNGPFVPQSWAYNPQVVPEEFSPAKARQLLKTAGWSDTDGDGLLDKDGWPFVFTIATNQGNEERLKCAQVIQRRLGDIGIKVKIKVLEWSVFITDCIGKKNFEAVLLGWSLGREPDNFDIWHSSKTREGEFNFIGFSDPQVDRLLEEARVSFDQEKRKTAYQKIHQIIYRQQPYMFLYVPDILMTVSSCIKGIKLEAAGIGYNSIDWWVPRDRQRYRALIEK